MSIRSVRVLGPIDAVGPDGAVLALGGPRHRAVLARLAVARGRTVPLETLVDDLWPDGELPSRPAGSVRTFVAALRVALEPDRPPRSPPTSIVTRGPGYALELPVDAARFEELAGSDPAAALALWRGPAYADLPRAPWAEGERARLSALRLDAVERLAQARLDAGRATEAVADLDAHTTEHPWREEGWRLLALALYRARREGDALAVLRRARTRLADELGLDPGEALLRLETDVLQRSPQLDRPSSDLWDTVTGLGTRAVLESTTPLLRTLAVHGGGPVTALRRHAAAVAEAQRLGDPDLTARLLGGYDVPSVWTRSDDPASSAVLVRAAEWCLDVGSPGRATRARLLATIALETRGLPGPRGPEAAAAAEAIARELGDPTVLRHALAGRVVQAFHRPGSAPERIALGTEILGLADRGEDPTSEILGHLVLLQARSGLGEPADAHVEVLTRLGERHESPGVAVLLDGFAAMRADREAGYRATAGRLAEAGMPGVGNGLLALALVGLRLRRGEPPGDLPDAGPYAPWVRAWHASACKQCVIACTQCEESRHRRLDLPDPPPGHVADALWVLAGRAGLAAGDRELVDRAVEALGPAAGEVAGANSGLLTFGPVADHLATLAAPVVRKDEPSRRASRPSPPP